MLRIVRLATKRWSKAKYATVDVPPRRESLDTQTSKSNRGTGPALATMREVLGDRGKPVE